MGIAFYGAKGDKGLPGPPGPPGRYQEIVGPDTAVNTTGPPGTLIYKFTVLTGFFKRGCTGWGANPSPLDIIYLLIFTTLPLSHSGSPCFDKFTWTVCMYSKYLCKVVKILHSK
jgi:hypothetical protein